VRLWLRHLLRDKEPTPTFLEAGICFVMIMLLQFAAMKFLGDAIRHSTADERSTVMMQILMIQQLVIIACPALFMGVMLTTSIRRTFRLRWPKWRMLAAGLLLPFALHPLAVELLARLEWFFPQMDDRMRTAVAGMADLDQPLWFVLLTFAVVPAVCEELAFRGFILSGFNRSRRTWLAIVLSSLAFGIMHMFPQQVFNAALLGLVLGLLAVRSRSLLPGIAFHLVFNALQVFRLRIDKSWMDTIPASWFLRAEGTEGFEVVRYEWPTLLLASLAAMSLLRWVARRENDRSQVQTEPEPVVAVRADTARL
ncbi:MAG: CPBP family glutamic-type intramembrane protease, partial [Planctomycetaceae bacterium]